MESELLRAVAIASAPQNQNTELIQSAHAYLQQLQQNTPECWQSAWNVFSARKHDGTSALHSDDARLFALNLVQDLLENRISQLSDPAAAVAYLQDASLEYIKSEFVGGSGERGLAYLRNKVAQALSLLLVQSYGLPPPYTLLSTLLDLTRTSEGSLNPTSADLVLRILHDLSLTLGSDTTLRSVRSRERLVRDAAVRDEIREHNASAIAQAVWGMLQEALSKVHTPQWPGRTAEDLAEMATRVVGDYVSWTDISLMVTATTLPVLFGLLQHPITALRIAAAETLLEVVSKGMKPPDKIELVRVLDLTTVITGLEASTRGDNDVEFRERLARLANGNSLELGRIVDDPAADAASSRAADELLAPSLPLTLAFLADACDDIPEQVLPALTHVLASWKKMRRASLATPLQEVLSPAKIAFTESLLSVCLQRMQFGEEADWSSELEARGSEDGSEDEAARFHSLRKNMQLLIGTVAGIDEALFSPQIQSFVIETLTACNASLTGTGAATTWQRAELALHVLYLYAEFLMTASGQIKSGIGSASFVTLPTTGANAGLSRAKQASQLDLTTLPLNALGQTVKAFFESRISELDHQAVKLAFFECAVRYASFCTISSAAIPQALPTFLDERGLRNPDTAVRRRVEYLFLRFINVSKTALSHEHVAGLLERMQDLLVVSAVLPPVKPDEDVLAKGVTSDAAFDSQLNLFEASSVLLSLLLRAPEQQVSLLSSLVGPLRSQLEEALQAHKSHQHPQVILQVHHLFLASSNLVKGFPDVQPAADGSTQREYRWIEIFKGITEQILSGLNELKGFLIIRDAARGAFARMIAKCGDAVLPYVPPLLAALLSEVSAVEMVDILSFVGLLGSRYKATIAPIMDELLPVLIPRVFALLNQDVSGTDDAVQRSELSRAYVGLLSGLISCGIQNVLHSEKNQSQFQTVLQSLVFYASDADLQTQRAAFSVLHRMVQVWGRPASANGSTNGPAAIELPGIASFVYETLVPLAFEAPSKSAFDFADAQSQLVLTEVCTLLKTIHDARGQELLNFLTTAYFPGIGCPPQLAQDFTNNLKKMDAKQLRKALQGLIQQSRG
ncbi:Nuclear mRNA export factor receptor LOS1/Exportin-t (importin beta superfamily) [Ceraceosorus bombacis]|uniref:Exportin-T n=1 Tax=Ceraceosorus bombacis TaxID=401625 RepID=A0A0P1BKI3_9BASI|nr:Nuclear mRNA export factor receptor LOS1/Exportin-t (importin beta superfamily) [Ceraceosorus bombacis]